MNVRDTENYSLLSAANDVFHFIKTKLVEYKGKWLDQPISDSMLMDAAKNGDLEGVKLLLKEKSKYYSTVNSRGCNNETALACALQRQRYDGHDYQIVYCLLMDGALLDESKDAAAIQCMKGDVSMHALVNLIKAYKAYQTSWIGYRHLQKFNDVLENITDCAGVRKVIFSVAWQMILEMSGMYINYYQDETTRHRAIKFFTVFKDDDVTQDMIFHEGKKMINELLVLSSHAQATTQRRLAIAYLCACNQNKHSDFILIACSQLQKQMIAFKKAGYDYAGFDADNHLIEHIAAYVRETMNPPAYVSLLFATKMTQPVQQKPLERLSCEPSAPELDFDDVDITSAVPQFSVRDVSFFQPTPNAPSPGVDIEQEKRLTLA